ncbi:hypothetical protein [Demequina activiva]|uniref:Uncharacterized protein n=1 Tax=Demequina activiva TaxID=1582364 RepID=A0A919UJ06_9MICO|nr:hypothetical protein [Demequina activiva]GIG53275.1 hypothetical protein Dac01nite_00270 [Demequina activiva]
MFSSIAGMLSFIVVLAVVVMVVAALAEGRGRHVARLILGVRSRQSIEDVFAPAPRQESDWSLIDEVASVPDRPAPGTRAAAWAKETAGHARVVVAEQAAALRERGEDLPGAAGVEAPRTGELSLGGR